MEPSLLELPSKRVPRVQPGAKSPESLAAGAVAAEMGACACTEGGEHRPREPRAAARGRRYRARVLWHILSEKVNRPPSDNGLDSSPGYEAKRGNIQCMDVKSETMPMSRKSVSKRTTVLEDGTPETAAHAAVAPENNRLAWLLRFCICL